MRKSCAAKADSCEGSAKVPVTRCMLAAAAGCAVSRFGLGLAAAVAASRSGSLLRSAFAASHGIRTDDTRLGRNVWTSTRISNDGAVLPNIGT
eukprot:scaffold40918_cov70-Phaeocystis_antarctica.AAC.4